MRNFPFFLLVLPFLCQAQNSDSLAVVREVDSLIQVNNDLVKQQKLKESLEIIEATEKKVLDAFGEDHPLFASCLHNYGWTYFNMDRNSDAEIYLLKAKNLREKLLGKEHLDYAGTLNNLAIFYMKNGGYEKADSLYRESKSIRAMKLGTEHPDYIGTLINMASLNYFRKKYDISEGLFLEAKEILVKTGNVKHPFYTNCLKNLSIFYTNTGRHEKAESLYSESILINEKLFGKESREYATALSNLARIYLQTENYEKSEKLYIEAISIQEKVSGKEDSQYAITLNDLSVLYRQMGKYEKVEPLLWEAIKIKEKRYGKEHIQYVVSLINLASFYGDLGQYGKAEPVYLEAKDIQERILGKKDPQYAIILSELSIVYAEMGDLEKSEFYILEAKSIIEKEHGKNSSEYARCIDLLASLYADMGYYEKSEFYYLEAKAIKEETSGKDNLDYSHTLNNLAILYREMGKYEKSEPFYLEAKKIREEKLGKEHPLCAQVVHNLAVLYSIMGNLEKSEQFYLESKAVREKVLGKDNPKYALTLDGLGGVYAKMGRYKEAEQLCGEARDIREKTLGKNHTDYANSLINLAFLYETMGNYEKAESLLKEATITLEKNLGENHPDYVAGLTGLAGLYQHLGRSEEADSLYRKTIETYEKILGKEHPNYAHNVYELATLYREIQNTRLAELLFRELIQLNTTLITKGSSHLSVSELAGYAKLYDTQSHHFLSFTGSLNRPPEDLIHAAWNNTLFIKNLSLESARTLERDIAKAPDNLRDIHARWKSYQRRLAAEYAKPIAERINIPVLESKTDSLEKILVRNIAGFAGTRQNVTWLDVQNKLGLHEAAIEFFHYQYYDNKGNRTDSTLYAALILRPGWTTPKWVALFEEKQLDSLFGHINERKADYVNHLYTIGDRGIIYTDKPDKSLYQLIWQPLEKELAGAKNIYYSPTGLLHRLNLNAISIGADSVLADKYYLTQLGSTRQLVNDRPPAATTASSAVLFGGIRYDLDTASVGNTKTSEKARDVATAERGESLFAYVDTTLRGGTWPYLPYTEKEVEALSKSLQSGAVTTRIWKGYEATEEAFKNIGRDKPAPQILHIATHGFFFPDFRDTTADTRWQMDGTEPVFKISNNPMIRSGLLLAGSNHAWHTGKPLNPDMEDGILTAYEISQMNLSGTELVVLSACETGLGDIEGNEGVYGLQRAFKIAGAKYLIMSLWQIPDKPTSVLMTTFYKKWLHEKMEIPEAFRAAQKEMREQGFEPHQWAGFVLVE